MAKGLLAFLIFWAAVTGGIGLWRSLSTKEKWSTVKLGAYGFATAVVAFVIIIAIVVLF